MNSIKLVVAVAGLALLSACSSKPVVLDTERRADLQQAEQRFRVDEQLKPYFDQAVAWAIFPNPIRGGLGFGGAYGIGWLVEGGTVTGKLRLTELTVGAQWGGQAFRQILFFRDQASVERFKNGTWEFAGQASAAAATLGFAGTPSFNQTVAMFTQVKGGLMLEASIGGNRYDYQPLPSSP